MRLQCALGFWAAGMLVLAGCGKPAPPTSDAPPPASARGAGHLAHALPPLPTIKLWLGDQELLTEVARTAAELQTGMMFRTNLAEGQAMLFVFPRPYRAAFYMRNTKVPLTAAYLDPNGTILELHDLKPLDENPVEAGSDRVQFVLEAPQGWYERHRLGTGVVVRTPYGALRELNWATLRPLRAR